MSTHQPASLTANPPPPFHPSSPDPAPDRSSRLHRRLSSIRTFMAREQLLFGSARVNQKAVEERVEQLRQHDEEDKQRLEMQTQHYSDAFDPDSEETNPSIEATRAAETNQNGLDGKSEPMRRCELKSECASNTEGKSSGGMESRVAAAANEAIEHAAEEEPWGWPGLGVWPTKK